MDTSTNTSTLKHKPKYIPPHVEFTVISKTLKRNQPTRSINIIALVQRSNNHQLPNNTPTQAPPSARAQLTISSTTNRTSQLIPEVVSNKQSNQKHHHHQLQRSTSPPPAQQPTRRRHHHQRHHHQRLSTIEDSAYPPPLSTKRKPTSLNIHHRLSAQRSNTTNYQTHINHSTTISLEHNSPPAPQQQTSNQATTSVNKLAIKIERSLTPSILCYQL